VAPQVERVGLHHGKPTISRLAFRGDMIQACDRDPRGAVVEKRGGRDAGLCPPNLQNVLSLDGDIAGKHLVGHSLETDVFGRDECRRRRARGRGERQRPPPRPLEAVGGPPEGAGDRAAGAVPEIRVVQALQHATVAK
jgi:hypothetical protein